MAKHFKFGGSTAKRTLACPAWVIKRDLLPKGLSGGGSNIHADRGTLLHEAMEVELSYDAPQDVDELIGTYSGKRLNDAVITDDDIVTALAPTIEAYFQFDHEHSISGLRLEAECEFDDEIGGTADIIAWNDDTVFILDNKFGFVHVDPEENEQGLFYAFVAQQDVKGRYANVFTKERHKLVIGILQPSNADTGKDIVQLWHTDMERLSAFGDEFLASIDNATEDDLRSGEHCKYCPVSTVCELKTGMARSAKMIDPKSNDMEVLSQAMSMVAELEAWCKDVRSTAFKQAELGTKIKGFKLVAKRPTRKWVDEESALDKVRKAKKIKLDEAVDMKLKSPAQFEKVCKELGVDFKKYADYISNLSTGSSLVPDSDKRSELVNVNALASALQRT